MKHRWLLLTAMFAALWELAWWLLNRDRNLWAKPNASYAWPADDVWSGGGCEG